MLLVFTLLTCSTRLGVHARTVTLSNTELPLDTDGNTLTTGEATFLYSPAESTWFAYFNDWGGCVGVDCCPSAGGCASCCFATGYAPDPCVYTINHTVLAYSTPDFSSGSWKLLGAALPPSARRPGIEFRPQVVHNGSHFLMWYEDRWVSGANRGYALAASLAAAGPFVTIADSVIMGGRGRVGDFDVFVDPATGRGYHVRTGLSIQPLDATLSRPEGAAVDVPLPSVEGPAMFLRGGAYYLLAGAACCACRGGSNVVVFTAPSPLGPWVSRGDVGTNHSAPFSKASPWNYVTRAQGTKVLEVPDGVGGTQYLWIGNQWVTSQAPGAPRNKDLLFFAVLQFSADGNITQMRWADSATLIVP
jgi:hypothetical protein